MSMRTRTLLCAAISLLIASAVWAQSTTIVGTCDQYQPGIGGDFCINTGSATYWQQFTGDVTNLRGTNTCTATNTTGCGTLTVEGIDGIPICGSPSDGQTLCYNLASNCMVWCAP
jgi:hypothetical protein